MVSARDAIQVTVGAGESLMGGAAVCPNWTRFDMFTKDLINNMDGASSFKAFQIVFGLKQCLTVKQCVIKVNLT